jgi:hypothetical protein
MITRSERDYIEALAYIPEHVPEYVTSISKGEAILFDNFLVYRHERHLTFVGYPLRNTLGEGGLEQALERVIKQLHPQSLSLIAPNLAPWFDRSARQSDHYYDLDLTAFSISPKLRSLLKRAGRELSVHKVRSFHEEHRALVVDFLRSHSLLDQATRLLFGGIEKYLSSCSTAWIFEARDQKGKLAAFDVAEFGSKEHAFYMFNFRSPGCSVPGASDMLLSGIIEEARREGKRRLNLGLGINPGVTFFKRKWGGACFLPYFLYERRYRTESLDVLLRRL